MSSNRKRYPQPFAPKSREGREWVLSQSLPLVQERTTPSEDEDTVSLSLRTQRTELLGQSTMASSQESFRSPSPAEDSFLDPSGAPDMTMPHQSNHSRTSATTRGNKKRMVESRMVSVKKEKKRRAKDEVLVLECMHCTSNGECHESKYGAFCFAETRRSIMASSPSMKQYDIFQTYSKVYTTFMNWENFQVHGANSGLDETLSSLPSCMLVGSYTRLCNIEH
jgi:hypothetical protein